MRRLLPLLVLAAAAPVAWAQSWQTSLPTVMYDAPSEKAQTLFILSGGYPLKEISKVDGWHKLSGPNGELGWIAADHLAAGRAVVVSADSAAVRVDPHPAAAAVFFARRGVVLEVLESNRANGWFKVLHRDGEVGYLRLSDSWANF